MNSKHKSDYGEWKLTAGNFYGDAEKDKGQQAFSVENISRGLLKTHLWLDRRVRHRVSDCFLVAASPAGQVGLHSPDPALLSLHWSAVISL